MLRTMSPGSVRTTAGAARTALRLGAVAATGVAAYLASGHHKRLGARPDEVEAVLPGDELLPDATVVATRAISIDAPVDYVWPWVAQLGQDKAGFYSYTWAENLVGCQITNADQIVAAWQVPVVGEPFLLHPELALEVAQVDPPGALVVRSPKEPAAVPLPSFAEEVEPPWDQETSLSGFDMTWAFIVRPETSGRGVRLIARERYLPHKRAAEAVVASVGVVSAVMTHGTLRGIRGRAERMFHSGV